VARTDLLLVDLFDTQPSVKPDGTLSAIRDVKTKTNLGGDSSSAVRQGFKQVSVVSLEVSQSQHTNPAKCQQSVFFYRKLSVTVNETVDASECSKLDSAEPYKSGSPAKVESRL